MITLAQFDFKNLTISLIIYFCTKLYNNSSISNCAKLEIIKLTRVVEDYA